MSWCQTGEAHNSRCEPCPISGCKRDCEGGKVDSVASAEKFRGCTHIRGVLEIALRASGGMQLEHKLLTNLSHLFLYQNGIRSCYNL